MTTQFLFLLADTLNQSSAPPTTNDDVIASVKVLSRISSKSLTSQKDARSPTTKRVGVVTSHNTSSISCINHSQLIADPPKNLFNSLLFFQTRYTWESPYKRQRTHPLSEQPDQQQPKKSTNAFKSIDNLFAGTHLTVYYTCRMPSHQHHLAIRMTRT